MSGLADSFLAGPGPPGFPLFTSLLKIFNWLSHVAWSGYSFSYSSISYHTGFCRCTGDRFRCSNGLCIPSHSVCDGHCHCPNCQEESAEFCVNNVYVTTPKSV